MKHISTRWASSWLSCASNFKAKSMTQGNPRHFVETLNDLCFAIQRVEILVAAAAKILLLITWIIPTDADITALGRC
jgi:hypothetical protein